MTLRAGSHNAAQPLWRGVIRDDGYPAYVCVHRNHASQPEATACARGALAALHATPGQLPTGWTHYTPPPAP